MGLSNNINNEEMNMEKLFFKVSLPFLLLSIYAAALTGFVFGGWYAINDQSKTMQIALLDE